MSLWENMSRDARRLNPHLNPAHGSEKFDAALAEKSAPKKEKELQNQLYALLYRRGHRPRMQRMDRRSNIALGMPDISFEVGSRSIFWEVKLPGKNPTDEQSKMISELEAHPNCAHVRVIRSYKDGIEDLQRLYEKFLSEDNR